MKFVAEKMVEIGAKAAAAGVAKEALTNRRRRICRRRLEPGILQLPSQEEWEN